MKGRVRSIQNATRREFIKSTASLGIGLWGAGVPLLAFGFAGGHEGSLVAGGWVLFSGTLVNAANSAHVLRHAFRGTAG